MRRAYSKFLFLHSFILLSFLLVPMRAGAGMPVPSEMMDRGGLFLPGDEKGMVLTAPLLHTKIDAVISGPVVRYRMQHTFINTSGSWTEAIYTYPLPTNSAVNALKINIGSREVIGQITEKAEAKRKYAEARKAGQRAGLVQQHRPNLFSTSLANIGPNERITVEIGFSETLKYENDGFRLRMPLVVGPRYIPGKPVEGFQSSGWHAPTDQVPDAHLITPPLRREEQGAGNSVELSLNLDAGFDVGEMSSPSHAINITDDDNGVMKISLKESVPADKDFTLIWKAKAGQAPSAGLFGETIDGTRYVLMMVTPPLLTSSDEIASPREVVFVIDTSGSMHGGSMDQAKGALAIALDRLKPNDTFRIIRFSSDVSSFRSGSLLATPENINAAKRYVSALNADGGTEIVAALRYALMQKYRKNVLNQIVLMTDGSVGNEEELFRLIHDQIGAARLFTVGIGSAPNGYLMTRAARAGRGTYTYIENQDEIIRQMGALFKKLEHPAMTNISVKWHGNTAPVSMWPDLMPDLYHGEPIQVLAALPDGTEKATLSGQINGKLWSTSVNVSGSQQRSGIAALWAREKIKGLESGLYRGDSPEMIKSAVLATALKFDLISRYTSLLAIDKRKARQNHEPLVAHDIPTNLPDGWTRQASASPEQLDPATPRPTKSFDRTDLHLRKAMQGSASQLSGLPQTATPGPLSLLLGLVFLGLGWCLWRQRRGVT